MLSLQCLAVWMKQEDCLNLFLESMKINLRYASAFSDNEV